MAAIARRIRALDPTRELAILEAGCGRRWPLELGDRGYRLTGVDLDAAALAHRRDIVRDLHVGVHGDLATVPLEGAAFDVIYSSFVLEHVRNAAAILGNFAHWLRPGGLLVLRIPDRDSAYGWVTRCTPFWLHVFYLRYLRGYRNAGRPGFAPYPTLYEPAISRTALHEFARRHAMQVIEERGFRGIPRWLRFVPFTLSLLTAGRLPWRHDNLTVVLRKEPVTVPGPGAGERARSEEARAARHPDTVDSLTVPQTRT